MRRRRSALRVECSSRGGCAVSTDDEKRLTPVGADVNGQDRPSYESSHADHHVMAKTGSARRHRQGPQAARMRGRNEATSLARWRAQIEHRSRDGRRIRRCPDRCSLWRGIRATIWTTSDALTITRSMLDLCSAPCKARRFAPPAHARGLRALTVPARRSGLGHYVMVGV